MTNKYSILFIVLIILVLITYFGNKNQALNKILVKQFGNNYINKTQLVGSFKVSYYYSSYQALGEGAVNPLSTKVKLLHQASPLIVIQSDNNLLNIYEIGFKNGDEKVDKGNHISLLNSYSQNNKVKGFVIASEWGVSWGGSDGLKGLVLFSKKDGKPVPAAGYPFQSGKNRSLVLTDKLTGNIYEFPITALSYYTLLENLNNDNKMELLYGKYIWEIPAEGHYDFHNWVLKTYEFDGSGFKPASWWNGGQEFVTGSPISNATLTYENELEQIFRSK